MRQALTALANDRSKQLTSQGKIPHDVEMERHPEKASIKNRMWLMGDVSALIHVSLSVANPKAYTDRAQDVKPAKEIIDEMVNGAKACIESGSKTISSGSVRAKL